MILINRGKITKIVLASLILICSYFVLFPIQVSADGSVEIKRGGVWKVGFNRNLDTLDIHCSSDVFLSNVAVYDFLIETKVDTDTGKIVFEPGLAKEWKWEEEGRRVVLKLVEEVKFHDGSEFNAEVAKWNLDRLKDNPESFLKPVLVEIENVEVINSYTIAINLKFPSRNLFYNLASGTGRAGMISKKYVEDYGEEALSQNGCGTGPFKLENWIIDDKVVLTRNNDYWKKGVDGIPLPYLDKAEVHFVANMFKGAIDLQSGYLDTLCDPAPSDIKTIEDDPNLKNELTPPGTTIYPTLSLNYRRGPFSNDDLRKAAFYAIDREKFVQLMGFGVAQVHQYPYIAEGQIGWDPDNWPDYSYDPEKAKKLVDDNFPNGVEVGLSFIAREPDNTIGQIIKEMWDAVGIKTELRGLERLTWIDNQRKDEYESATWAGISRLGTYLDQEFKTGGPGNWGNYTNPEVDKLLEEFSQTINDEKAHEIMSEAFKIIHTDVAVTSAYSFVSSVASWKYVNNLHSIWCGRVYPAYVWLDK
jgi:peptide/nickel transport system substrate-binding protein